MGTYEEVIDFLFQQFPSYQNKGGKAYKVGLDNIISMCNIVGNPHEKLKTIHIAGTNGKGTVSNYLTNIYQKNGYKVGTFTSPHLIDFRERITINGKWIAEEAIIQFYKKYHRDVEHLKPSFFEWSTALAFHYFKTQKTDINIIETGLGGRLDSTNVIQPLLSIITTISLDHKEFLGDNIYSIAKEKAGIIKQKTPVLLGSDIKETFPVFQEIAKEKNAPLYQTENSSSFNSTLPKYLLQNWETAKNAVSILEKDFAATFKNKPEDYISIKGRWQIVQESPKVVLDVGHNEQGVNSIVNQLSNESFHQLHIVMGFSSEKEIGKIGKLFPKNAHYYITKSTNERSVDPILIKEHLKSEYISCFEKYQKAIEAVQKSANKDDFILICGSVFLIGDVLRDFF